MPKTAIAYLRISEDPKDTRSGVTRQREDVRALAERLGAELLHVYEDNDLTASVVRPENSQWVAAMRYLDEHPETTYLLGWRMDRLGRRLSDIESVDDRRKATGIRAWTTAEGDVFENPAWPFLAAQAKVESENTRRRVARAMESRKARGKDQGGRRAYGYDNLRQLVPEEVEIIREAGQMVMDGRSVRSVVRALNDRGVTTSSGGSWSLRGLLDLLRNPRYAGRLVVHGEDVGPGAWKPVWSPEEWATLQAAIPRKPAGAPTAYLLSGTLRCGLCQTLMSGAGAGTYRCNRSAGGCGKLSRSAAVVESAVLDDLWPRLENHGPGLDDLRRVEAAIETAQNNEVRIQIEYADLKQRFAQRRIDAAGYYTTLDINKRQSRAAARETERLVSERSRLIREATASVRWGSWDGDQRRSVVRDVYVTIILHRFPSGLAAREIRDGELEFIPRDLPESAG